MNNIQELHQDPGANLLLGEDNQLSHLSSLYKNNPNSPSDCHLFSIICGRFDKEGCLRSRFISNILYTKRYNVHRVME